MSTQRKTHQHAITLAAPADDVFRVLCPVEEKGWVDGWEYEMLYSASGVAEPGCIFKTKQQGNADTIWLFTRHDPRKRALELVNMTPDSHVAQIEMQTTAIGDNRTRLDVSYTLTRIGSAGQTVLEDFTAENFQTKIDWWAHSIPHYLSTGQLLKRP